MIPDRYPRVRAIVLAALAAPHAAREALLDEQCAGDASLRAEVESLLAQESGSSTPADLLRPGGRLDRMAARPPGEEAAARAPARIGPYRILGLLGEGGMGRVYLAQQEEPIRREVALKLVQRGLDSRRVLERFALERQVLARLDHPAIARVLDAGSDSEGRPWFAMELVAGESLTEYCDAHSLGVRSRLELFVRVCAAVQHAHQRGVLHRDLKPGNILVGTQDGAAVPKVIDFGIAKALDPSEGPEASMTQEGQWLGTPDYMSPEQAGLLDTPVDTRSDVYALGVILYELLAGVRPVTPASHFLRSGERDARVDVVPPSQAWRTSVAERPGSDSHGDRDRRPRRGLAGDLDTIVAYALRTEPHRRYPSVEHLADDVRRYLAGLPVLARTDTWWYRTGKFATRHRIPLALAAAGVLWLGGFAALSVRQAERVAQERDRARAAEHSARLEAETARQVSEFLVALFEASEPGETKGAERTARELLDRGRERLEERLVDQPLVRARLLMTVASVYQQLVLLEPAEEAARRALALRREASTDTSADVAESLDLLATLAHDRGEVEAAAELSLEALAIARRARPAAHPIVIAALTGHSTNLQVQGRYDEALALRREALTLAQQVHGRDHAEVGYLMQDLGYLEARSGRPRAAVPLYRQALTTQRRLLGPRHPDVIDALNGLAMALVDLGAHAEAESLFRAGLAHAAAVHGADGPYAARALMNLGRCLVLQGRSAEALPLCQRAAEIHGRVLGTRHRHYASALLGVARAELGLRRFAAAERHAREVLAIRLEALGPDGVGVGLARMIVAAARESQGDVAGAERLLREALELHRRQYPDGHPDRIDNLEALARLLHSSGRADEAAGLLAEAASLRRALESPLAAPSAAAVAR